MQKNTILDKIFLKKKLLITQKYNKWQRTFFLIVIYGLLQIIGLIIFKAGLMDNGVKLMPNNAKNLYKIRLKVLIIRYDILKINK
jgi:hypothetical protein